MPSIIQAIKEAILTETSQDITVKERSFWSQLLSKDNRDIRLSRKDFKLNNLRAKSLAQKPFIIIRFLIWLLHDIFLAIVYGCYACYAIFHAWITGSWQRSQKTDADNGGKTRSPAIYAVFHKQFWQHVKENMHPSAGINFIVLGTILVIGIVIIAYIIVFNINNVVLVPNNLRTNSRGVVSIDQAGTETHSFFLLNAASFWTPTDIYLSRGDRVYISVSGSMYGDILNMDTSAEHNHKPDYSRSIIGPPNIVPAMTSDTNTKFCIYGRNHSTDIDAKFGSLLYQISSPRAPLSYNKTNDRIICQVDLNKRMNYNGCSFTAKNNGMLYFCFNDILLDSVILSSIKNAFDNNPSNANLQKLYLPLEKAGWYQQPYDSTLWFQDNLGEVLINIRVEHNLRHTNLPLRQKILTWCYRRVEHFIQIPWWPLWLILMGIAVMLIGLAEPKIIGLFRKKA